nr:uncharacterized protein LOC129476115 isoform X2 [Symphalangus syndactylus]
MSNRCVLKALYIFIVWRVLDGPRIAERRGQGKEPGKRLTRPQMLQTGFTRRCPSHQPGHRWLCKRTPQGLACCECLEEGAAGTIKETPGSRTNKEYGCPSQSSHPCQEFDHQSRSPHWEGEQHAAARDPHLHSPGGGELPRGSAAWPGPRTFVSALYSSDLGAATAFSFWGSPQGPCPAQHMLNSDPPALCHP